MPEFSDIIVTHTKQTRWNGVRLQNADDTGRLRANLDPLTGDFRIEDIEVDTPRVGLGKYLLRCAQAEAQKMQATAISAVIVSAECLDSMAEVFGYEHIQVDRRGVYGDRPGETAAFLNFPLQAQAEENPHR
ncbi:MAG: hypothetical protein ABIQ89_02700 [Candidatus Saccharimonadales bacterium]